MSPAHTALGPAWTVHALVLRSEPFAMGVRMHSLELMSGSAGLCLRYPALEYLQYVPRPAAGDLRRTELILFLLVPQRLCASLQLQGRQALSYAVLC